MIQSRLGVIVIGLSLSLAACVKLNPDYIRSSGALFNNYSLYEDSIKIVYAARGNFGDWETIRIVPREGGWGQLEVTRMTVETVDSKRLLPITQCYEPVDGINILRCDVSENPEGVNTFTIRQAFEDEPSADGLDIAVKQDQVVIQLNPEAGKKAGNLVGEFEPFKP